MTGWRQFFVAAAVAISLAGCGDGNGAFNGDGSTGDRPAAPTALVGNAGDSAVGLAWTAPAGAGPFNYTVSISPSVAAAVTTVAGTTAVVRNLANDTAYTFSIKAGNSAGAGPATSIAVTPTAVAAFSSFDAVTVLGDAGATSGIHDGSLLRQSGSEVWMAYSSVSYRTSGGILIQDVSTSLARSTNGGSTFNFVRTLGAAGPAIVTDSDPARSVCGAATCSGRWVYETPWLLDDSSDPDASRRYKVFAHKYFLSPGRATGATLYHLGAIVMWTAPSLNGTWSAETRLLGWNRTPAELLPVASNINAFSGAADCILLGEGGAAVTAAGIDLVFNCPFTAGVATPQKIVLLRSTDHAQSFQFVSTLLQPDDATSFGNAQYFSAPSIIPGKSTPAGNGQVLLVTPVISRTVSGGSAANYYSGCVVIPFADTEAGTLVRDNANLPLAIATLPAPLTPVLINRLYGACAWDRGISATGILINDVLVPLQLDQAQFRVRASKKSL